MSFIPKPAGREALPPELVRDPLPRLFQYVRIDAY